MRVMGCPHETAVWRSALAGEWAPGLAEHASSCGACREVALVTRRLASLGRESPGLDTLPDPRQIWWRARWLRSSAAEKAARPVRLYQRFAAVGVMLSVVATGFVYGTSVTQWIPVPQGQWTLFGLAMPAALVTLSAAALAGLAVLLALRAVLVEE